MQKKPIGQILKENGYINDEHIEFALKEQKATGERLGEVLTRIGLVTDFEIAKVLAQQTTIPFMDPRGLIPDIRALSMIPAGLAQEKTALPFKVEGNVVYIIITDPFDTITINSLKNFLGPRLSLFIGPYSEVKRLVEWHYYFLENTPDQAVEDIQKLLVQNPSAPIPMEALINNLLILAITRRATDLHISPTELTSRIFLRIDGLLELVFVLPASVHNRLVSAIKARAGMDIAEQRLPQDGRMRFEFLREAYDLRISTVRSPYGENMVIRLLPVQATILHLSLLGFDEDQTESIKQLFRKPYGIVLITGPTGSGKTTTLYSALRMIDVLHLNVLTAEDPVEYRFPLIRQTQVAEDIGYDFPHAVRHFLRQDPDVILIGEMRDEKTSEMGVRAALTGHLVLSTLHANDALSAIPRLRDLGISGELLASSLIGVIAQRLVRQNCPYCKISYMPPPYLIAKFDLPEREYFKGKGCTTCRGKGYLGRTAVAEIIVVSERLKQLIASDKSITIMQDLLKEEGFKNIRNSARKKIMAGELTAEEAERVLG